MILSGLLFLIIFSLGAVCGGAVIIGAVKFGIVKITKDDDGNDGSGSGVIPRMA